MNFSLLRVENLNLIRRIKFILKNFKLLDKTVGMILYFFSTVFLACRRGFVLFFFSLLTLSCVHIVFFMNSLADCFSQHEKFGA